MQTRAGLFYFRWPCFRTAVIGIPRFVKTRHKRAVCFRAWFNYKRKTRALTTVVVTVTNEWRGEYRLITILLLRRIVPAARCNRRAPAEHVQRPCNICTRCDVICLRKPVQSDRLNVCRFVLVRFRYVLRKTENVLQRRASYCSSTFTVRHKSYSSY